MKDSDASLWNFLKKACFQQYAVIRLLICDVKVTVYVTVTNTEKS